MSANDRQVGGTHYQTSEGEQHWDRMYRMFGPGYLIGCVTKYIERHQKKGGLQDLEKAQHYVEKLIELESLREQAEPIPNSQQKTFDDDVKDFNRMYGVGVGEYPQFYRNDRAAAKLRMEQFMNSIKAEVAEGPAIIDSIMEGRAELDILTDLADWLGDIIVYAASEMAKWGLPMGEILQIIMQSNFSKMGADGKPIILDGKVQKGPNYWKPEPKLRQMLAERIPYNPHEERQLTDGGPNTLKERRSGIVPAVYEDSAQADVIVVDPRPEDGTKDWQNEGYFGDGTALWRCRQCRTIARLHERPNGPHNCGGHPAPISGALPY